MPATGHLFVLTFVAAAFVVSLAGIGVYLSTKVPRRRTAVDVLTAVVILSVAIIFASTLNHVAVSQRDGAARVWAARSQHLERLQVLMRAESASLRGLAEALRQGRYFTLVADDARKAVWTDDTLTFDVERHFPEYFHERERLIREILQYDDELGRIRRLVSASLQLGPDAEPHRLDLVQAIVRKCAGAAPDALAVRRNRSSLHRIADRSSRSGEADEADDPLVRVYERYRCSADLTRLSQAVLDRAADLADAARVASEAARRYGEETVLHGSCTYAPAQ